MDTYQRKVLELLKDSGFIHQRSNRHNVFRRADGIIWTTPLTPSDSRAWKNNYTDLRRLVGMGDVKLRPPIIKDDPVALDSILRPPRDKPRRPIRERQRGLLATRVKTPQPVAKPPTFKPKRPPSLDAYQIGAHVRRVVRLELDDLESSLLAAHEKFLRDQWKRAQEQGVESVNEPSWAAYVRHTAAQTDKGVRDIRQAGLLASRIFQRAVVASSKGKNVEFLEVLSQVANKLDERTRSIFGKNLLTFANRVWQQVMPPKTNPPNQLNP